jgi:exosortase
MRTEPPSSSPARAATIGAGLALGGLILWAYWPALGEMAEKWRTDPQYSHGYLVPVFAAVLLYLRRGRLDRSKCRPDWRGLIPIALGAAMYATGGFLYMDVLSAGALIPTLLGAVLILGGPAAVRWAWPMILFLGFMIPLPYFVETAVGQPLQSVATHGSTWVLQTLGFPAVSEGNTILLEHGKIAVVEACSGLSMLLTFAALTTGMAMVIQRPMLDRVILVASTIPVALAVNIARISGNGIAIEVWDVDTAHRLFHDQGGWLMMPLAIALLWLELWVIGRVLVEAPGRSNLPVVGLPVQQVKVPPHKVQTK